MVHPSTGCGALPTGVKHAVLGAAGEGEASGGPEASIEGVNPRHTCKCREDQMRHT